MEYKVILVGREGSCKPDMFENKCIATMGLDVFPVDLYTNYG
jgi:hypothetical protein